MKKFLSSVIAVSVAAFLVASCSSKGEKMSFSQAREYLKNQENLIEADSTLTEDESDAAFFALYKKTYDKHLCDSLDSYIFSLLLAYDAYEPDEAKAIFAKADTLIKNNPSIQRYIKFLDTDPLTAAGQKFTDIEGPDVLTGESLSIAATIAKGKPVLVDFWASWCPPCRRAIKDELIAASQKYGEELCILGIAVWEASKDDTVKAMNELGVCWPVMFGGNRQESVSDIYSIKSIPTLVAISSEGTILYKGHSAADALAALGL